MNRKSSHQRRMLSRAFFGKPITKRQPILTDHSLPNGQPRIQPRRIFVIRQATQFSRTNSTPGKNIQHILVFDDHADSLRLVLEELASPTIDRPAPRTWWVFLFSILMLGLLIAMFWPLFL